MSKSKVRARRRPRTFSFCHGLLIILSLSSLQIVHARRRPSSSTSSSGKRRTRRPEIMDSFTRQVTSPSPDFNPTIYESHPSNDPNRRRTTSSSYLPMRITFETSTLAHQISSSASPHVLTKHHLLLSRILPTISNIWSSALSVRPIEHGLRFTGSHACFDLFVVPPNWIANGLDSTDLVIFVSAFQTIDETDVCEPGTLAAASYCNLNLDDRPISGFVNICLDAIEVDEESGTISEDQVEQLEDVLMHEVGHVLGLNSSFLRHFRDPVTGEPYMKRPFRKATVPCVNGKEDEVMEGAPSSLVAEYRVERDVAGNNVGYYEVVTPTVRQVVRNQFDCRIASGVRLENTPTNPEDCTGSHFDERFYFTEFMSAFYDQNGAYFSPLTLALLEDSGHYRADYTHSSNSPFGIGVSCAFLDGHCIDDNDGTVPYYGRGFFCDVPSVYTPDLEYDFGSSEWKCGVSHHFRGHCDLFYQTSAVETPYFDDPTLGPFFFTRADHCPIVTSVNDINCDDTTSASKLHTIEEFSTESKCMDLTMEDGTNTAFCLRGNCNEYTQSYEFHVGEKMYNCREDFERVVVVMEELEGGETFEFLCPRIAQICPDLFCPSMCSGKGTCNWNLPRPACECFDVNDRTPNCNDSTPVSPKKSSIDVKLGMKIASIDLWVVLSLVSSGMVVLGMI